MPIRGFESWTCHPRLPAVGRFEHHLRPGGRLLLIDFIRTDNAKPAKFGQGTIGVNDLAPVLETEGFIRVEQGDMPMPIRSIGRSHDDYG
jgi:hypothetical protein